MKKLMLSIITSLYLFTLLTSSCSPNGRGGTNGSKADSIGQVADTVIKDAMQKKQAYERQLKAMTKENLFSQLALESEKGVEPFNSLAYKEAVSRGRDQATWTVPQIKSPDKSSLLALLAVRFIDTGLYRQINPGVRIASLTDALQHSKLYNVFGLPHVQWEEAAKAIISENGAIRASLISLLRDTTADPVWGSEDYREYLRYQYRVCDYAFALLREIDQQKG